MGEVAYTSQPHLRLNIEGSNLYQVFFTLHRYIKGACDWNFNNPDPYPESDDIKTFLNMVWKKGKKLGLGIAKRSSPYLMKSMNGKSFGKTHCAFVVARYKQGLIRGSSTKIGKNVEEGSFNKQAVCERANDYNVEEDSILF